MAKKSYQDVLTTRGGWDPEPWRGCRGRVNFVRRGSDEQTDERTKDRGCWECGWMWANRGCVFPCFCDLQQDIAWHDNCSNCLLLLLTLQYNASQVDRCNTFLCGAAFSDTADFQVASVRLPPSRKFAGCFFPRGSTKPMTCRSFRTSHLFAQTRLDGDRARFKVLFSSS